MRPEHKTTSPIRHLARRKHGAHIVNSFAKLGFRHPPPNHKAAAGAGAPTAASVSRVYSVRSRPYPCARGVWWYSSSAAPGATVTL